MLLFKSACLRGPNLYGQTMFFDFAQILQVATFGLKVSRAKGFLSQPSESAIPACPSKMAEKSPHVGPRKRVLPQRTGMENKRNVITPTFTNLSTFQKLKDSYTGTFVKEPGDDSPKQLIFTAKIAQFQPHFLHLMQSQILHSKQS